MPDDDRKTRRKDLRWLTIICFIMGLIPFLLCLGMIYHGWKVVLTLANDDSVPAFQIENLLSIIQHLAFGIMPLMGLAFIFVGYKLRTHYRR